MRISDWSSDVCSSDLGSRLPPYRDEPCRRIGLVRARLQSPHALAAQPLGVGSYARCDCRRAAARARYRSEDHTSEPQSLMRISYAVFCLKKKNTKHID